MKAKLSKRSALIGLALLAAGLTTSLASAAPANSEFVTVVVQYADLDLAQPDGARSLYGRIKTAARRACGEPNMKDLARFAHYRRCYEKAVAGAVTQLHSTRVSELLRSETEHTTRG